MSRKEISVSTLYGHTSFVHSIAFNHDNTLIVSGSFDNLIKIWKVYQSKCVMTFGGHEAWVTSVAFNPNGTQIVSGSGDKTIRVSSSFFKQRNYLSNELKGKVPSP